MNKTNWNKLRSAMNRGGFKEAPDHREERNAMANAEGLRETGAYEVEAAWTKGDVTVLVEQNTAPDPWTGQVTVYPSTAVIEGPNYRVACAAEDVELVLSEAGKAAGEEN